MLLCGGFLFHLNKYLLSEQAVGSSITKSKTNDFPAAGFSGASGVQFSGNKIRSYNDKESTLMLFSNSEKNQDPFQKYLSESAPRCLQWAVVTTIFEPNESIIGTSRLKGWCIVIVGDTITPDSAYEELSASENVVYLSASKQQEMLQEFTFMEMLPWKSFARKNIGFLFAISFGAKVIYDFDDDNILLPLEDNTTIPPPFFYSEDEGFERTVLLKEVAESDEDIIIGGHAFNPYPFMSPDQKYSWPRGFPIDQLQKSFNVWNLTNTTLGSIEYSSIGVIQSLCNTDPDSDAVFRLTRKDSTNFKFDRSPTALPLLIPSSGYTPFNAQATTHLYHVFWGLYLPCTVPGRVTDIWRSFIMQRIMRELGLYVLYTPPIVTHERTAHNYIGDMTAEADVYTKTSSLLALLDQWSPTKDASTLPEVIFELWIELYEHDYIELHDVETVKEYLRTLIAIGYEFPKLNDKKYSLPQKQPSALGQPYRSFPHFTTIDSLDSVGDGGWWSKVDWSSRSDSAVLKLILMTMNEWPLVKSWVLYHGHLIGFENLYIIDSSTETRIVAFLRYARDHLGVNVIFGDVNLNEITKVMTEVGMSIGGSSDIFIKMDTDEFLMIYDEGNKTLSTSVSNYLADFATNENHPLRLKQHSCVGYVQNSAPSIEVCEKDIYAGPEKFPLGEVERAAGWWKAVHASNSFSLDSGSEVNLGGHAVHNDNVGYSEGFTNFAVAHFHYRCVEIEMENSKRAIERHDWIAPLDTDEVIIDKLFKKLGCKRDFPCGREKRFCRKLEDSFAKGRELLKFLRCPDIYRNNYYGSKQQTGFNRGFNDVLEISEQKFDL